MIQHALDFLILINSVISDPYNNDEQLTLRCYCYQPLLKQLDDDGIPIQPQNATLSLENTFDALLTQFKGTLQALLKGNEHKYVLANNSLIEIERVSSEMNDDLIGIIVTIKLRKFTHCLLYN